MFDKPVPDPVKEWHWFAAVLQAVLDAGAKPMVTFAKFHPPFDDPRNIRDFVSRCCEIVWGCIEQWGGDEVKDWYWCVWNEPNNPDHRRRCQLCAVPPHLRGRAAGVLELLEPHLGGRKARFGGPAIDGTQRAFWMDWIAQLVADVDDSMLGFVNLAHVCGLAPGGAEREPEREAVGCAGRAQLVGVRGPGDGADPDNTKPGAGALLGCCTAATSSMCAAN